MSSRQVFLFLLPLLGCILVLFVVTGVRRPSVAAASQIAESTTVVSMSKSDRTFAPAAAQTESVSASKSDRLRSVSELAYRGNATPGDTIESLVWAKEKVDTQTLTFLISMSAEVATKAKQVFEVTTSSAKSELGITSPEQLVAFLYATSPMIDGLKVIDTQENDERNATVNVDMKFQNGHRVAVPFQFRNEAGGWRYVLLDKQALRLLESWQKYGVTTKARSQ